jgi:glycosyltransferase involved in cell wall biosynthesis
VLIKREVDVTVVVPTIPPRADKLQRALRSVANQTVRPRDIVVQSDTGRLGAALNRDAGLARSDSTWTAFLDDDDELEPQHIEHLLNHALSTDADLVYPWFTVIGGTDPFPFFEGQPWDNSNVHQVPITFLVKTELAKAVGGFSGGWSDLGASDAYGNRIGEDLHFIHKFVEAGHKIAHLNERTWRWWHWADSTGGNTSGLPDRW